MKKLVFLFVLVLGLTMTPMAGAQQTEYEKCVSEYLAVTNTKATVVTTLMQTYTSMGMQVKDMNGMVNEMMDAIWPDYTEEMAKIMSEYYSIEELNEIIKFYKSPVGKKFAEYSPEVTQKVSKIMMQPKFLTPMQNVIMKYMK
ncbi:MAG: DUF2059 domain-containing protein [Muribaculaceae bacterium]|nr:DUF2059 domain-containing protein [Muribaculaceae bacterium]